MIVTAAQQPIKRTRWTPSAEVFPLSIDPSGRFLQSANGQPFLIHGDSPWSLEVQCTHAQIDQYLNTRQSQGMTAILFETHEHLFSGRSPKWSNAQSSVNPFTTTNASTCSWASRVEAYWTTIDYIVNQAKARNMVCLITPAYLGFGGGAGSAGDQGWMGAVTNGSAGDLQDYGAFLANRYAQGNIIWVMGGDYAGNTTERDKQWNIVTGMRSVRTDGIITGHPSRADEEAHPFWGAGYAGFNFNIIYSDGIEYDIAAAAYARTPAMPFILLEGNYEGGGADTPEMLRRQSYAPILAGACGHLYGNSPVWGFGEPEANGGAGPQDAIDNHMATTAALQQVHAKNLFAGYAWQKLQPKTDTSLVTTSLGTGTGRVMPALASDGSFAMVWSPGVNVTVNMAALAPSSVRARLYNTTAGTYAAVSGSPFANTGTQAITIAAERVLVLDAA